MIFVVNAATARAQITQEAAIALSQHGTVAPVTVHNRLDFAASMIDGRTVMSIDALSKSASEIVDLWRYSPNGSPASNRRTRRTGRWPRPRRARCARPRPSDAPARPSGAGRSADDPPTDYCWLTDC